MCSLIREAPIIGDDRHIINQISPDERFSDNNCSFTKVSGNVNKVCFKICILLAFNINGCRQPSGGPDPRNAFGHARSLQRR